MEIKRICQIYFSPTGTTERVVCAVAEALTDDLGIESFLYDFTLPGARGSFPRLAETDLVLFGCPTYAGRLRTSCSSIWTPLPAAARLPFPS